MVKIPKDTLLGLVFFAGLALLLWATLNLTRIGGTDYPPITVRFENAGQVQKGDPVFMLGKRIGVVQSMKLLPNEPRYRAEVVLEVDEPVQLSADADIAIEDATFLGGKQVSIDPGTSSELAKKPYKGRVAPNPLASVGEVFAGDGESNQRNFASILDNLNRFLESLNNRQSTVGRLINQDDLYEDLLQLTQSLRRTAEALEDRDKTLGRLFQGTGIGDDLAATVSNLREITNKINQGDGALGRLVNDTEVGDDLAAITGDFAAVTADLRAGRGAVGKLFSDADTERTLGNILVNVDEAAASLNNPEAGALGRLFSDPRMSASIRNILMELEQTTYNLNNGEGLLASLLSDPELTEQVDRMFNQISRAIEDAREAAPLGTLFSVVGGAF